MARGPRGRGCAGTVKVGDRMIGRPGYLDTAMIEGGPGWLMGLTVEEVRILSGGVEEGRVLAGGVEGVVPLSHY